MTATIAPIASASGGGGPASSGAEGVGTRPRPAFGWAFADSWTIAWRNLVAMRRVPQVLVFSTI